MASPLDPTPPVPWLLELARTTRFLPKVRGLSALLRTYRCFLPHDRFFRVNDFDDDLKLNVNVCEAVGINMWHAPRLYEKTERHLFCGALCEGAQVLDVGANLGIYTLLAAKRGAHVFSIEPDPVNLHALLSNIGLNGLAARTTVFGMAATDQCCEVTLHRNPANWGGATLLGSGTGVTVEGKTIDSLDLPSIDVCKMDIEGAEIQALSGMTDTLARSPNLKLLIEYSPDVADPSDLLPFLHNEFHSVSVVGGSQLNRSDTPSSKCNLWACRQF